METLQETTYSADSHAPLMTTMTPVMMTSAVESSGCRDKTVVIMLHFTSGVRFYTNILAVPVLIVFGTVGNLLTLVVTSRISFGFPSTLLLLRSLAVADLLYLGGATFFQTLRTVQFDTAWLGGATFVYPYLHPYVWPYMATVQTIETWLVVGITIDRYIGLCYPLRSAQYCTVRRARLAVLLIVIFSAAFNVPHFLEFSTKSSIDPCTNTTVIQLVGTALFDDYTYQIIYWSAFTLSLRFGFPLGILLVLTIRLLRMLREASQKRREMTATNEQTRSKSQERVTLVLMAVIVAFAICETIELMMHVLTTVRWTNPGYGAIEDREMQENANTIGNLMLVVNASINFILYCAFAQPFRTKLQQMCGCRTPVPEEWSTAMSSVSTVKMSLDSKTLTDETVMDDRMGNENQLNCENADYSCSSVAVGMAEIINTTVAKNINVAPSDSFLQTEDGYV